jgi:hypothetical protein
LKIASTLFLGGATVELTGGSMLNALTRKTWLLLALTFATSMASAARADEFIAGVDPSVRPAGAPVITQFAKDAAWYRVALTGVEKPYPSSLRFLEDQGAWYTPFSRPGMTGPYDIRNWHCSASCGAGRSVSGRQ